MQHINLEKFANGAFTAQVNRAIEEVTKNIQDEHGCNSSKKDYHNNWVQTKSGT